MKAKKIDYSTKELGVSRNLMNSLALFLYYRNFNAGTDVITIYNEWAETCNIKVNNTETLANLVEYIRKLSNVSHEELSTALEMDDFKIIKEMYI
ncbi:MAG: hypothetical protein LIP12_05840 [Clostridiales bacterium]|nr:hypothetical protein [Clostridiales bacterium]